MNRFLVAAMFVALFIARPALAETTECTEITSIPTIISVQGIYCLKQNLVSSATSGNMIDIQTNNVTIDMNGFKLGGTAAGTGTNAIGIYANDRKNITIHNGTIRGFFHAIQLDGSDGFGHVVENIRADRNRFASLRVLGNNVIVRNNLVINTGDGTLASSAYAIYVSDGENVLVSGNIISGVSETSASYGIYVADVDVGTIIRNFIFDLTTASSLFGIHINDSSNISTVENRVVNNGGGTTAIVEGLPSTGLDCIGNIVRGYTTGLFGCDFFADNHIN